jgi:hypothetical protein
MLFRPEAFDASRPNDSRGSNSEPSCENRSVRRLRTLAIVAVIVVLTDVTHDGQTRYQFRLKRRPRCEAVARLHRACSGPE